MLKRNIRRLMLPFSRKIERVKIIQTVVSTKKAKTYLEIGVDQGKVFEIVHGPLKIGVDPVSPAPKVMNVLDEKNVYIQKTSDDFFTQEASKYFETQKIDVAFIDGLHEYSQVLRDIENTLQYLEDDGVILVHDCSPWSRSSAIRAFSFAEAKDIATKNGYNDWDGGWTGDVWKSIVDLRSKREDLEIFVLDCDCGIGVIRKSKKAVETIDVENIKSLEYEDLAKNKQYLLNLKSPEYFLDFIKTI